MRDDFFELTMTQTAAPFDAICDDPAAIVGQVWSLLENVPAQAAAAWRLPVLGTTGAAGCELRTLVLRAFDAAKRRLICHTDVRSPKIASIQHDPAGAWLFYDPVLRVQLRVAGPLELHSEGALADQRWAELSLENRRAWLAPEAPGAMQSGPFVNLPPDLRERPPTWEESEAGRRNFCVLTGRIDRLDWYYLRAAGHLRLQVTWTNDVPRYEWLAS